MTFRNRIVLLVLALAVTGSGFAASAGTLELSGPAGASCVINDQDLGFFPLDGILELKPGYYTIISILPGFFTYEKTIFIETDDEWIRVHAVLMPLKKSTAWKSNLLYAGLGQFYMDKKVKGWVFSMTETAGLLTAFAGEAQRLNYKTDYILFKNRYDASINADEIAEYRQKADTAYANMEDMESLRNTGLMIAGGAVVLSILDALFFFPNTEVGPGTVPLQTGHNTSGDNFSSDLFSSFHAGIRVSF